MSDLRYWVRVISSAVFTVFFACGCTSPPSVRDVGNYLETVPLSTEMVQRGDSLHAVGVSGMENVELRIMGHLIAAPQIVDHILRLDPNEIPVNLIRFYPEDLLLQIESDDKCFRLEIREQTSFMSGELLLFLSSSNRFKGYWGWSSRKYSQDDAERLNASRMLFRESIIEVNQAAMREREKSNVRGGATYLVPALPLGVEPESVQEERVKK